MARPNLNEVEMNSIDIDSYVIYSKVSKEFNDSFRQCIVRCARSILNDASFDFASKAVIGMSLTIKRGVSAADEQFEFEGFVEDFTIHAGNVFLIGGDQLKLAQKKLVTKSWDYEIDTEAGKISEIFQSLYNDYTTLTASATGVQDSGTLFIRRKFICNNRPVFESAQELADNLDWQQYYKPSAGEVFFEPKGYTNSTEVLQTGVNIIGSIKWDYKSSAIVNKVKIIGAEQEVETEESGQLNVTADWNTTSVQLTKTPKSVKVYYGVADPPTTLFTGGDETTSGAYEYEVDPENKLIKWATTTTANYYVQVNYSHLLPTPVVLENTTSRDTYYPSEITLFKKDLTNVSDAELYGRKYLENHSVPFKSTVLSVVNATDLEPGQKVRVVDNETGIDEYLLITKVEIERPYKFDKVWVGDEELKTNEFGTNVDQRIKRLEEEYGKSQDLLVHIIDLRRDIRYERRYWQLLHRTAESGVLYWDNDSQGDWDDYDWGDDTDTWLDGDNCKVMIPGNNTFKELFYDDLFTDLTNCTATIATTGTQMVTFTDGDVYISKLTSKGVSYNYQKVVLGSADTTYLNIEVSSDGKGNWQSVSHNTRTQITNVSSAGTAVRITATSAATMANEKNASGQIIGAAVKIIYEE